MESWILILLAIAIIAALVAAIAWLVRRYRRETHQLDEAHQAELATARSTHERELASALEEHAIAVKERDRLHGAAQLNTRNEHNRRIEAFQKEIQRLVRIRDASVNQLAGAMRWELASRDMLVRGLNTAQMDAVVATNLVFTPHDESAEIFCAQIDHLVITENVVAIVESKHWNGVVFDGTVPSKAAPAFSALFDEDKLSGSFAVHVSKKNRSGTRLEVRYELGESSPAEQCRTQAGRLHTLLKADGLILPLIKTCVFYSHPQSQVITGGLDRRKNYATVIADTRNIAGALHKLHNDHTADRLTDEQFAQVIAKAQSLGADLTGTGRHASIYQSPVPLEHRLNAKGMPKPRPAARPGAASASRRRGLR